MRQFSRVIAVGMFTLPQFVGSGGFADVQPITEHCFVDFGTINGVVIRQGDQRLAVYGWDGDVVDQLLLTHGRRDVVWRAHSASKSATIVAPTKERFSLSNGPTFWTRFPETRFHDYGQQTTKISHAPLPVSQWVTEGDVVTWNGLSFRVLETPGYTRGSATYVVDLDGKRIAFTGDLIYGEKGQIIDLYSYQDAIPDSQIRGYHGYGARLSALVDSLNKLIDAKVDLIVPARGPVIRNPSVAANLLITRVQQIYRNYLSTSALHWYFGADRMDQCGERVLGEQPRVQLMPFAKHEKTPEWIFENSTSRLLVSENGRGFLLDWGYQRVIDAVQSLIDQGVIEKVDGIFVTHFHDDHTDMVQTAAEKFKCPVYATDEYADVLERPDAYHLPAMTANPIRPIQRVHDGQNMQWEEFSLTFQFFPGQTWYHGAMLVEKAGERPVFFVGDAFAPSGIDDYCVLNRNLLHDDEGYFLCLKKVRQAKDCWLVNEHINHVFTFTDNELSYIENQYRERRRMLAELFPWDDPNYGVDEQWAVMYPRGSTAKVGDTIECEVRITNHSPTKREFVVNVRLPNGIVADSTNGTTQLLPHSVGAVKFQLEIQADDATTRVVTADVSSPGMSFASWADAYITVAP